MKVLIFGGNGFLGNALKNVLDENNIDSYTVSRSNVLSNYNVDISNLEAFESLPKNFFNVVINCATILPGGDYLDSDYLNKIYKTNILGTQNICKWIAEQATVKKIINCSTLVVVKKPWDVSLNEGEKNTYPDGKHVLYSASKLMQELIFKTFSDNNAILLTQIRFSSLYGETMNWNGLICNLIDQAKNNNTIKITNGKRVSADFLHVNDAAKIILASLINDINGVLNGASGVETTILNLAEIIKKFLSSSVTIYNVDEENSNLHRASISVKKLSQYLDVNNFISLEEGIKKMIK
jgi:UDP-glucose 4-epimerase